MRLGLLHRTQQPVTRSLRRRDLGEVMAIERVVYPRPWTEQVFRTELERVRHHGDRQYLALTVGRSLAGYAGQMYAAGDAHVTNIAVHPDRRRQGLGRRLLAELAWGAVHHGCTAMTLEVRTSNHAAQELYRTFGFDAAGTRPKYYENIEDAVVMWRHGIATATFAEQLRELCPEAVGGLR